MTTLLDHTEPFGYRTAAEINSAMSRVYGHMALAVLFSMLTSMAVSSSAALMAFLFTGIMKWIVIFAPLVAIFALGFGIYKMTKPVATVALYAFSALMGLSFATIFVVFNMGSIVTAFMGGAILFATLSFWGYFTKRDLSGWGTFLLVGLIAVIIASIVNVFIGSSALAMTVSAIAILVFLGLTAYDTQRIREMVSVENTGNLEILGALTLYLNFINIFLSLLQLIGTKNE